MTAMKVIVYSRFSDPELQDERSIEDQQRVCGELVAREMPDAAPVTIALLAFTAPRFEVYSHPWPASLLSLIAS